MVAYRLKNTLSDFGTVSRAICTLNNKGKLERIIERKNVKKIDNEIFSFEENRESLKLNENDLTSMNMFAFSETVFPKEFLKFLINHKDDMNQEFYLPNVIQELINQNECEVEVIKSSENWIGMTYKQDKEFVVEKINTLVTAGIYPQKLW